MNQFNQSLLIKQKLAYNYLALLIENKLIELNHLKMFNKLVGRKVEQLVNKEHPQDITFNLLIEKDSFVQFLAKFVSVGALNYSQLKEYDEEMAKNVLLLLRNATIRVNCYKCGAIYNTSRVEGECVACMIRKK